MIARDVEGCIMVMQPSDWFYLLYTDGQGQGHSQTVMVKGKVILKLWPHKYVLHLYPLVTAAMCITIIEKATDVSNGSSRL